MNERHDIGKRVAGSKAELADEMMPIGQLEALTGIEIGIRNDNGTVTFPSGVTHTNADPRYKKNVVLRSTNTKYIHTQSTPALEWSIQHNLNTKPFIEIVTFTGIKIYTYVQHLNLNSSKLIFKVPYSGQAYCF